MFKVCSVVFGNINKTLLRYCDSVCNNRLPLAIFTVIIFKSNKVNKKVNKAIKVIFSYKQSVELALYNGQVWQK